MKKRGGDRLELADCKCAGNKKRVISIDRELALGTKQTVRDVIGPPNSWPSYRHGERPVQEDLLKGAIVSEVAISDEGILLATFRAVCGPTFEEFLIEDRSLRERTYAAIRAGSSIDEAVAALI